MESGNVYKMLRIFPIAVVILGTVARIRAQGVRVIDDLVADVRPQGGAREAVRDPQLLTRILPPPLSPDEGKLSYVEKLLVAERIGSQNSHGEKDGDEEAFVSDGSVAGAATLGEGVEPTSDSALDQESSEERLQITRQTSGPVHPESPCPSVFSYEGTRAGKERWNGVVLVTTDVPLTGIRLVIRLNKKAQLLGNWLGEVCSKDNIEFRIWNAKKRVQPGPPLSVKFFVKYSDKEVDPPRIRSIQVNGRLICSSTGAPVTHRPPLITTRAPPATVRPVVTRPPVQRPSNTPKPTHSTTARPTQPTRPIQPGKDGGIVDGVQCGRVEVQASPFITHGQHSSRGQWPWHAALYQAKGTDLSYICGGTLIGKRNVLTAAHCVTRAYNGRPVDAGTIFVYLGKYHLNLWTTGGVQDKQVDVIKVHPEYNSTNFFADIAIVVLTTDAEFTLYVKPVCLWDRDRIALKEVEGVEGTVVGWGYDERGIVTEELMMAKMPVVSQQTCIWSYPAFFPRFTSEQTYCAGFRNGTSVCNGDSGGGMVFPRREKPDSPETWYLRGLVSLGASMENKRVCNTKHYVVFTDVAKYLDWIQRTVAS